MPYLIDHVQISNIVILLRRIGTKKLGRLVSQFLSYLYYLNTVLQSLDLVELLHPNPLVLHKLKHNASENKDGCQNNDPDLKIVIKWLKSDIKPSWEDLLLKPVHFIGHNMIPFLVNKILYHKWESVLTKSLKVGYCRVHMTN